MAHDVTFIPGDGTGPELTEATRRVLKATGVDFNWDRHEAGIDEYTQRGNPFTAEDYPAIEFQDCIHGSSPTYAGKNRMNPTALMLSGVHMLDHLKESAAARVPENAIAAVIHAGDKVTYDLKPSRTDPTAVGASEFADAVIEEMNA